MKKYMLKKNLRWLAVFVLLFIFIVVGSSIKHHFNNKLVSMDEMLTEVSGIEFDKKGKLWAINDGGDQPNLYRVEPDGTISKTVLITNAKNIDWEDMTQDDFGHFFLGDFGNNENKRKWLTIYKIENPIDIKGETTSAEIIKFMYPEQISYPPKENQKKYDLEAFVFYKKKLYLFTKNRSVPFDGETNLYRIGAYAANHQAKKLSSFTTCTHHEKLCWITSAALSPNKKKLVLLDSQRLWLFENWQDDDFFSGDAYEIDLGTITQKESVTFYDDNTVVYTDEEFMGIGRNAYLIKLDEQRKIPVR
jgi:hypothetical protein